MQVGKLRDRIRLLALTGDRDAAGEPLDTVMIRREIFERET